METETYLFRGIVTALSSLSHNGGQSFGINSKLRREKFVQPDGSVEEVPVISGNAIRGILRDLGMRAMCRQLGYGEPDEDGRPLGLTLPAFHFLFSGGALTAQAGRGLDVDLARQLRTLIPLVSVFGGGVGNQILPGKLKVGKLMPFCLETAHLQPDPIQTPVHASDRPAADLSGFSRTSVWEYLQEEMYTRRDDEKDEHKRQLLAPEVKLLMDQQREVRQARTDQGAPDPDVGQHQQMMYYVETFAAGAKFSWEIFLDDPTTVEFEAFLAVLAELARAPYIGGKSAVGLGKIAVQFDGWHKLTPNAQPLEGITALDAPIGARYADHLAANAAAIRQILREMR